MEQIVDVALPPEALRERVAGTSDPVWFVESGRRTLEEWSRVLTSVGKEFASAGAILDFGCGCGRFLRHLHENSTPGQHLVGADVDEEAVNWVIANIPLAVGIHLPDQAPSPIPDASMDIIVCNSVFSHLPEEVHLNWLADLHRVAKPGGLLLISVHGRHTAAEYFNYLVTHGFPDAEQYADRYNTAGFYHVQGRTEAETVLPAYYGHAFFRMNYIEDRWLPGRFDLLAYFPKAYLAHQDMLVLRKT